jgi:hypothetical protein
MRKQVSLT